jgi:hypothetical protein
MSSGVGVASEVEDRRLVNTKTLGAAFAVSLAASAVAAGIAAAPAAASGWTYYGHWYSGFWAPDQGWDAGFQSNEIGNYTRPLYSWACIHTENTAGHWDNKTCNHKVGQSISSGLSWGPATRRPADWNANVTNYEYLSAEFWRA